MNHAITIELQFFLISVISGAIILLVYDFLRIMRRIIKHDSFFTSLEDLFFWVGASLFIFAMIYKENDGIIRGFCVMGMAIGMVLYHFTLSNLIVKLITNFIHILLSPFVFAIKQVKKFLRFLWSGIKKTVNFVLGRLKKWTKSVRIALSKKRQVESVRKQKRVSEKLKKSQEKNQKKNRKNQKNQKKSQKNLKNQKQKQVQQNGKKE
jgi:spore cortex biosynthesis protein YabQ